MILSIKDLHVIGSLNLKSSTLTVKIVELLRNAIGVPASNSSILHEFNILTVSEASRSRLRSISHNGDLEVSVLVSDSNGGLHWIEVFRNVLGCFVLEFLSLPKSLLMHI